MNIFTYLTLCKYAIFIKLSPGNTVYWTKLSYSSFFGDTNSIEFDLSTFVNFYIFFSISVLIGCLASAANGFSGKLILLALSDESLR